MKPALVAAVMLASLIYLAPRSDAEKHTANAAAKIQSEAPSTVAALEKTEEAKSDNQQGSHEAPHWDKSSEWIPIIVGIFTVFVIVWQALETRRGVEASKLKDRARISVEIDPLKRQPVLAGELPETHVTYTIRFDCPTNAFDVSAFAGAWIGDSQKVKIRPQPPLHLPATITPDIQFLRMHASIFPKQLSAQDFEDVRLGKQFVQFFGVIRYTDIFGKERQTKWHRLWKPLMELHDYWTWEKIGWWFDNRQN